MAKRIYSVNGWHQNDKNSEDQPQVSQPRLHLTTIKHRRNSILFYFILLCTHSKLLARRGHTINFKLSLFSVFQVRNGVAVPVD